MPGPCTPIRLDDLSTGAPVGLNLRVPFARCADGTARHVTMVSRAEHGPFTCLGCGESLALREPQKARRHFAHKPGSICGGVETVLHRYAKELFLREKTLTLPERKLTEDGLIEIVATGYRWLFDSVYLEHRLGDFQPDARALSHDVELLVEFRVTHAVDETKQSKVQKYGVSMLEIDLSGLAAQDLPASELDHAILHSSPRRWIHHRKDAAGREKLTAKIADRRAKRAKHLARQIETPPSPKWPQDWGDRATPSINQLGLGQLVDLKVQHEHWFTISRPIWQAEALVSSLITRCQKTPPGGARLYIGEKQSNDRSRRAGLPSWMIRSDLDELDPNGLAEAGYDQARFGSPELAVWRYFEALNDRGGVVSWDPEQRDFFVLPELHGFIHRECDLRALVERLLKAARSSDPASEYSAWCLRHVEGDVSVGELIETGGPTYDAFRHKLGLLKRMNSPFSRAVVDDLCGLPLEPIRERVLTQIAADEADRIREEREVADARRADIRREAEHLLGSTAGFWLSGPSEIDGISMIDFAATSVEAYGKVFRAIDAAHHKQNEEEKKRRMKETCLHTLKLATHAAIRKPEAAALFLNSSHPKLQGRRPIDYCESEATLQTVLTLLSPKKQR